MCIVSASSEAGSIVPSEYTLVRFGSWIMTLSATQRLFVSFHT